MLLLEIPPGLKLKNPASLRRDAGAPRVPKLLDFFVGEVAKGSLRQVA
jgi:hypothetical protein